MHMISSHISLHLLPPFSRFRFLYDDSHDTYTFCLFLSVLIHSELLLCFVFCPLSPQSDLFSTTLRSLPSSLLFIDYFDPSSSPSFQCFCPQVLTPVVAVDSASLITVFQVAAARSLISLLMFQFRFVVAFSMLLSLDLAVGMLIGYFTRTLGLNCRCYFEFSV